MSYFFSQNIFVWNCFSTIHFWRFHAPVTTFAYLRLWLRLSLFVISLSLNFHGYRRYWSVTSITINFINQACNDWPRVRTRQPGMFRYLQSSSQTTTGYNINRKFAELVIFCSTCTFYCGNQTSGTQHQIRLQETCGLPICLCSCHCGIANPILRLSNYRCSVTCNRWWF